MADRTRVIAHRGVHTAGATENTIGAFEAALAAGADMIELDVRRTGAGELAVLHDHDHRGVALASCSLEEFQARAGLRPPLLAEVLDWARGRIALDVELKEDGYADEVAPMLADFAAAGGELLVTSFLDPLLAQLARLRPSLHLGLLVAWTAARAVDRAHGARADVLLPEVRLVDETLIAEVTGAGLELIVWDYMPGAQPALLPERRIAGVITDDVPGARTAASGARMSLQGAA